MQEGGIGAAAAAAAVAAAAAGGDAPGSGRRRHKRPPVWQLITGNLYTHRERKEQDEDDIMICQVGAGGCWRVPGGSGRTAPLPLHATGAAPLLLRLLLRLSRCPCRSASPLPPPAAWPARRLCPAQCKKIWATDQSSVGCGPECLNRMLNIECVEVRPAPGCRRAACWPPPPRSAAPPAARCRVLGGCPLTLLLRCFCPMAGRSTAPAGTAAPTRCSPSASTPSSRW